MEIESRIVERLIALIGDRREKGRKKYGKSMERTDITTREWVGHAIEELLDAAIYLERIRRDMEFEWKKEPTGPGWYWVHFGDIKQSISCLYVRMTEAGLTLGYQPIGEMDQAKNMRWCGPIRPPAYEGVTVENTGYRSWR